MFAKLIFGVIFALLAVALAESRVQPHRGLTAAGVQANGHPYLFLTVPHGRLGSVVQGFEVLEDDVDDEKINAVVKDGNDSDDDDDNNDNVANDDDDNNDNANDDDDDDDDEPVEFAQHQIARAALDLDDEDDDADDEVEDQKEKVDISNLVQVQVAPPKKTTPTTTNNLQMILQNAKPTQMMIAKDQAGAIMVPDGIIEIEGQSIIDEKTGKPALLVPQAALDAIPDGSVVALMERAAGNINEDDEEEERANRVIVRRRRRGSRRNVRRRGGNRIRRRRVNNVNYNNNRNRRRRINRNNVRVIRRGNGNNQIRRRNNNRRNNNSRRKNNNNRRRRVNNRPYVVQG